MCAHQNHIRAGLRPHIQRGTHSVQFPPRTGIQNDIAHIGLGRKLYHHVDHRLLPTPPTCPPLTTGSSAGHSDFPPEGTGHGFQLAHTAVSDAIIAAHRIVDFRAHPLALAHSFPILHCAYCPKCTLHSMAWGWGLVWGGCGTQSTFSSSCGQSPLPCNSPSPGWEWWRKS